MAAQKNNVAEDGGNLSKIKKLIDAGEIDAISIDTTVFDDNGMRLDKGLFAQLQQFSRHPSDLIISEVVLKEIQQHLTEHLQKAKGRFSRDMADACEFVGGEIAEVSALKEKLSKMPPPEKLCEEQIEIFIEQSKAKIVVAEKYIQVGDLLKLYFEKLPPFHNENPKKKEFPDAIALASLDGWANAEKRKIVVVSRDGDWQSYCEKSENLYLVRDFATALELFQKPDQFINSRLARIRSDLENKESDMSRVLRQYINEYDVWETAVIEADSQFEFEEEGVSVKEIVDVVLLEGEDGVRLTDVDEESISINCDFQVEALFTVEFRFRKWDNIDKEYIRMGRANIVVPGKFEMSVNFNLPIKSRDFEEGSLNVFVGQVFIEAGEIEPDWMSSRD